MKIYEESLNTIILADFPEKWPELSKLILGYLESKEENSVITGLLALKAISKLFLKVQIGEDADIA